MSAQGRHARPEWQRLGGARHGSRIQGRRQRRQKIRLGLAVVWLLAAANLTRTANRQKKSEFDMSPGLAVTSSPGHLRQNTRAYRGNEPQHEQLVWERLP